MLEKSLSIIPYTAFEGIDHPSNNFDRSAAVDGLPVRMGSWARGTGSFDSL